VRSLPFAKDAVDGKSAVDAEAGYIFGINSNAKFVNDVRKTKTMRFYLQTVFAWY